mmetsp:Transcript_11234/g.32313  ORF Transcript_11234/g.32313 Transcript_11234/m.32313 type:complete len:206 (-) Transcript_11234:109-726(-)
MCLLAEVDLLAHVLHGNLLGCCHDDGPVNARPAQVLDDREVLVRCAGRCVHNEVVQRSPVHVRQKLLNQPVLPRPSPDHRVVWIRQHETDRHHQALAVSCPGQVDLDRSPARSALMHLTRHEPEHARHAWPADVHVQQPDLVAASREAEGQLACDRALAHSSLAREHKDLVLDVRQLIRDNSHGWVFRFPSATCTGLLVGASCAC